MNNIRQRLFYGALLRNGYNLLEFGNRDADCSWVFCPDDLHAQSVVYGGGVGRDISFEHALVKRFGCDVVLFDPSPTGAETMSLAENQIPQFKFHPVALAGQCGQLTFAPPKDQAEGSWFAQKGSAATLEVPCVDLLTLMRRNGHDHIDLIKIDIEGAEYDVIDHVLEHRLRVRQILVEYHHQMLPGIRRSQTIRSMLKLIAAGYRLLKQVGNNHTFLHRSL
jgi:FkbM family methyltransferase